MKETILLDWDTFSKQFEPTDNHINENASFDGCMFETYGEEFDFVKNANPSSVWTVIETDSVLYKTRVISGLHLVNRLGYIVTSNDFSENTEIQVLGGPVNSHTIYSDDEDLNKVYTLLEFYPHRAQNLVDTARGFMSDQDLSKVTCHQIKNVTICDEDGYLDSLSQPFSCVNLEVMMNGYRFTLNTKGTNDIAWTAEKCNF